MRLRAALGGAATALAIFLVACSGGSGETPATVTVTEAPASAVTVTETVTATSGTAPESEDDADADSSSTEQPRKDTEITDQPGSVDGFVGARSDAAVDRCAHDEDGILQAQGTVTNPTDEIQDYRLYVSAMTGDDTMGIKQVDVADVEPGDSGEWATSFDVSGDNLRCVLRVERFAPQG